GSGLRRPRARPGRRVAARADLPRRPGAEGRARPDPRGVRLARDRRHRHRRDPRGGGTGSRPRVAARGLSSGRRQTADRHRPRGDPRQHRPPRPRLEADRVPLPDRRRVFRRADGGRRPHHRRRDATGDAHGRPREGPASTRNTGHPPERLGHQPLPRPDGSAQGPRRGGGRLRRGAPSGHAARTRAM
ncbi:MAG: hypothetical protein AVDCRST_MAG69-1512, partial [uncultured Solirubrobacteraceae bacterium]